MGTLEATFVSRHPEVCCSLLSALQFISYFLSSKKHIFHMLTSLRQECILHPRRLTPGVYVGFSVTWGHVSRRSLQTQKSVPEVSL